nr:TolC family protein [Aquabacterium sp. A08]
MAQSAPPAADMARRLALLMREAPEVAEAQAALAGRYAELDSATYARWPQASLSVAGGDTSSALRGNPSPEVDARVTAGLRYTLIDYGQRNARVLAAEQAVQSALAAVEKSQEKVAQNALTAYLQVLRFALLTEVGHNSQAALTELERLEARRVELGGAGITDAKLAASRLAVSTNKLAQFELSLQEALSKFAALYGFAPDPAQLPVLQVPTRWLQADLETAVAAAIERSPAVRSSRFALEQARADLQAEEAARFPAVDVTLTKRYEYPGGYSEKPRFGVQVSVGSGTVLEAGARVARALSRRDTEAQRHETLLRDLRQMAQAAWQRQRLGATRVGLLAAAATDSLTVFNARARLNSFGRETTLALLDAQVESNNVLIDWVNAIFDQRVGELDLAKETGGLVPGTDAELPWAQQLFAAADYRAPVRAALASATPRPVAATPTAPAGAMATPLALPKGHPVPDFKAAQPLRLHMPRPDRQGPQTPVKEFLVTFALDVKPFSPKPGRGW